MPCKPVAGRRSNRNTPSPPGEDRKRNTGRMKCAKCRLRGFPARIDARNLPRARRAPPGGERVGVREGLVERSSPPAHLVPKAERGQAQCAESRASIRASEQRVGASGLTGFGRDPILECL